jgi:hypothetical protein
VLRLPDYSTALINNKQSTVNFCDLTGNSERFGDTSVRTQATIITFRENQFIYDPSCYRKDALTWIDFRGDEAYKKLNNILSEIRRPGAATRVHVTVSGRLEGPSEEGFGHLGTFKYRFVITAVEDAKAVPPETPWPWDLQKMTERAATGLSPSAGRLPRQ